jgi:hypothetical protein
MVSAVWEITGALDEQRIPAVVENSVWLTLSTKRLRGPDARSDNFWLRQCLERLTGLQLAGEFQGDEWGAVLLAEWHFIEGGSRVRLLVPPAGVQVLRSPERFAKIEADAVHRLPPHGRRLYALLADKKRQTRKSEVEWSLPVLKGLLGVDDKKSYDVWNAFRKWVLTPAVSSINDFGTVHVKMTPIKDGRAVVAVRFEWDWKDPHEATETHQQNERHSKARRKDQESADAPPMIDDEESDKPPLIEEAPQLDPALKWWGELTNDDRLKLSHQLGPYEIEGPSGKITGLKPERDIAAEAYRLSCENPIEYDRLIYHARY